MNKLILIVGILLLAAAALFKFMPEKTSVEVSNSVQPSAQVSNGYKNISYQIEGQEVLLENGLAETFPEPNSTQTVETEYFGNEARGDFNNDGKDDVAFILTQSGSGTGVFWYVVAAIKTDSGYKGTNAIFLGDRIAPQTTEFRDGKLIVNYADRKAGEPFSAEPTVGVSKYLKVNGSQLVEVAN